MFKKILCLVLCVILSGSVLAGCGLIVHNDKKDAMQVVATVNPITYTRKVNDIDEVYFTSEKKVIYKADLISSFNQNAQDYIQNQGMTQNATVDALLQRLIVQQLLLIEADRLVALGEIELGKKEENEQIEGIYDTIDSQLKSIQNEIRKEFGDPVLEETADDKKETTYPVKKTEETLEDYKYYKFDENGNIIYEKNTDGSFKLDKDGNKIPEYITWEPSKGDYPCMWGDEKTQSLERESVLRFVELLKKLVKEDFKVTDAEKEKFKADDKAIDDVIKSQGVQGIYPMLGKTYYMEYLVGKNVKQSILLTKLQDYILKDVNVTEEEVRRAYNSQLSAQKLNYTNNAAAYETDVKGGTVNILYNPNSSYFYVKHILLPFSKEQTDELAKEKAKLLNNTKKYEEIRAAKVSEIVVYPHVKGEDDKENPTTVKNAFNEIYSAMYSVKASKREAERTFDDLIYKYNTDPGVFDKPMGYAVKTKLAEGETATYMKEFEDGARKLRSEYNVGEVLPEYVVTDYGVHIMYLANTIAPNTTVGLYDYQTPGQYKKIYEMFEDTIKTNKDQAAFEKWQNEQIVYYENSEGVIEKHTKRYKSLYSKD